MQSDTITTGGMLGKYNPTMTIFALKNWCNWKDKAEVETAPNNGILDEMNEYFRKKNQNKDVQ